MDFDPLQIFMAIIRYVIAIGVVVIAVVFIFSFKVNVATDEMERTGIQLAENIMKYDNITSQRAVFDEQKLDDFILNANRVFYPPDGMKNGDLAEKEPNIEPVRQCSIAYKAEIEDLVSKKKWGFGYTSGPKDADEPDQSTGTYDVSVNAGGKINPGRLTVIARRTWLSRIECLIEDAYEFKQNVSMQISCTYSQAGSCLLKIKKEGWHICLANPPSLLGGETQECRYFTKQQINIVETDWAYPKKEQKILTAYPLEEDEGGIGQSELQDVCKNLKDGTRKIATGEVKSVVLCIE